MWNTKVHVGFDENLFKWMTQTASQITSLNWIIYPIEKAHIIRKKVEVSQAGWASGLRRQTRKSSVENSGTRVCAWVRIPLLSENVLNTTRQSLQLTNSVILERQFKMTVQSKRKQTTRNVIGWLMAEWFKNAQKRKKIPSEDMWNTKVHVGFDENLFKWMTQTA